MPTRDTALAHGAKYDTGWRDTIDTMQARAHPNLQLDTHFARPERSENTRSVILLQYYFCNRFHFLRLYIALAWPLALPFGFLRSLAWRWSRAVERDPTPCVRCPLHGLPDPDGRAGMV